MTVTMAGGSGGMVSMLVAGGSRIVINITFDIIPSFNSQQYQKPSALLRVEYKERRG